MIYNKFMINFSEHIGRLQYTKVPLMFVLCRFPSFNDFLFWNHKLTQTTGTTTGIKLRLIYIDKTLKLFGMSSY